MTKMEKTRIYELGDVTSGYMMLDQGEGQFTGKLHTSAYTNEILGKISNTFVTQSQLDDYYTKTDSDGRFATSAQGSKADTAYQLPSNGIPKTDLAQAVQTSLGLADTALQSVPVFAGLTSGLVPSATAADAGKALMGDGTWGDVSNMTVTYTSATGELHLDFSNGGN